MKKIIVMLTYLIGFSIGYGFGIIFQNSIISELPEFVNNFIFLIVITLFLLIYVGEQETKHLWRKYKNEITPTSLPPITSSLLLGVWIQAYNI